MLYTEWQFPKLHENLANRKYKKKPQFSLKLLKRVFCFSNSETKAFPPSLHLPSWQLLLASLHLQNS
jgi:hypothetical protein